MVRSTDQSVVDRLVQGESAEVGPEVVLAAAVARTDVGDQSRVPGDGDLQRVVLEVDAVPLDRTRREALGREHGFGISWVGQDRKGVGEVEALVGETRRVDPDLLLLASVWSGNVDDTHARRDDRPHSDAVDRGPGTRAVRRQATLSAGRGSSAT